MESSVGRTIAQMEAAGEGRQGGRRRCAWGQPVSSGVKAASLAAALAGALVGAVLVGGGPHVAAQARADVRKVIFVCVRGRKKEICPQYRASVEAPEGWIEDKIAEARQGRIIFVPRGKTYETSPAAITVQSTPNRARTPVETLGERGNEAFRQDYKEALVAPLAPVANPRLGAPVRIWRQSAPGLKPRGFQMSAIFADRDEEGTLFAVEVVLSAATDRGLAEMRPKLEAMLKRY